MISYMILWALGILAVSAAIAFWFPLRRVRDPETIHWSKWTSLRWCTHCKKQLRDLCTDPWNWIPPEYGHDRCPHCGEIMRHVGGSTRFRYGPDVRREYKFPDDSGRWES